MTATVEETEVEAVPELPSAETLAEINEAIDALDDESAALVISFLSDEVDHLIPMPEEVDGDPREALRAVAAVRPDAVGSAATRAAFVILLQAAFEL